MFYENSEQFHHDIAKRLCLVGMSGIGKTHLSRVLRGAGWYHYSVDYRIATRYMKESIDTELRRLAMETPRFATLLCSDSITISSKLGIDNLDALTAYLGSPGSESLGGVAFDEYKSRLREHETAERNAIFDYRPRMANSKYIYNYDNFVLDTSGSFCHVVNPRDNDDPILNELAARCLIVHIECSPERREALVETFRCNPKPIYYPPTLLDQLWREFTADEASSEGADVNPRAFAAFGYERILDIRFDLYRKIAARWGYVLSAESVRGIQNDSELLELVAHAIDADNSSPSVSVLHRDDFMEA